MKVQSESEVAQSCLTLSDPMDGSLPGSSVHGIFQARVLEWGAIAFSERLFPEAALLRGQSAHDHQGVLSTGSRYGSTSAFPVSSGDHKLILWKRGSKENPANSGNTEKT